MHWKVGILTFVLVGMLGAGLVTHGQEAQRSASPTVLSQQTAAAPSDEDLIEKQKICPVTDMALGSMGKPVKVVVKGRTVFLCCAGCTKKLMANPDKYLKKLDGRK